MQPTDTTGNSGAAAQYHRLGWNPIPIKERSKEPDLINLAPYLSRRATREELSSWAWPGVGVVTGPVSGILVLDVDGPEGMAILEEQGHPPTPMVRTASGGRHLYFKHPETDIRTGIRVAPGLDVKAAGGYVVAPPSVGPAGKPYEWIISPTDAGLADPPEWLHELVQRPHKNGSAPPIGERIPAGKRNNTLASVAGTMRRRGMEEPEIRAALEVMNRRRCDPPLDDSEVEKIARSVASYAPESFADLTVGGKQGRSDNSDTSDNKFHDLVELPDPEEFPVSALPLTVRQFVREAAASVGCPIDYIGISTLAALSAAIGDTRRIVIKKDWTEGATIYAMIIGGPASKKTPAMNLTLRPIRERQMDFKAEYERQKEEYEGALRDYEKAKKDGPSELLKPDKPTLGRTYADDTTVERLADILNENKRGLLIIKDELSGWLGAMNQYKQGGKGADRQFWLSAHTNQPVAVDRKSSDEPVIVAHPFVSIIGGIQPEVLPDFGKDRGDGLIDRFISVYPEPRVGRWSDDEISDHVREEYASTIGSLYRLTHAGDEEDPFPSRVPMSTEAKELFVEEYNKLHDELESPGFPQRLRPPWGKLEAYLARLALILAMTRLAELSNQGRTGGSLGSPEKATREDMAGAIKLLAYFKNHTRRVYTGLYGDRPSDRLAADLRVFLINHGGAWEGIASELHEDLQSDYKPERVKDFGKIVRAIAKHSPLLQLEDLQRTNTRRPFRLILKNVVTVDTVVTGEAPA